MVKRMVIFFIIIVKHTYESQLQKSFKCSGSLAASSEEFYIKFYYTKDFQNDFRKTKQMNSFFNKVVDDLNQGFNNTGLNLKAKVLDPVQLTISAAGINSTETLLLFERSAATVKDLLAGGSAAVLLVQDFIPAQTRKIMLFFFI